MRDLITNDLSKCVGCNRCIRACPVRGANIAYEEDEQIRVRVDNSRCIACGACITACQHDSRDYYDDTERFLNDLRSGIPISLFAAPANRTNGDNWGRLLTWLRQQGVRKIYDVSLGADICTWGYIRYIQKYNPPAIITQPCPAIVNYIMIHNHDLLPYLSPVQSPMLSAAIYMKKYEHIDDRLAALSPCIAKTHEFEATHYVEYNVTLKKLYEYIQMHGITLPMQETGFDGIDASLGRVFSMPGGLKENVELHLGKSIRVDKSEGQGIVYEALQEYGEQNGRHLPVVFDVLNCLEGCNKGTGCANERGIFEINTIMEEQRRHNMCTPEEAVALYEEFDRTLNLNDFLRKYTPMSIPPYTATDAQIEQAFAKLGKTTDIERKFDCSACGSDTCYDMARRIACGLNIPENCIQKERNDIHKEHTSVLELSATNLSNIDGILEDISKIRGLSNEIIQSVSSVNTAIEKYNKMANEIDAIAMHINIISLNASIEAARAGQHGKAFAVVADEIRKLAHTSKNTVSETEQITQQATGSISGINEMVEHISAEVEKAFLNITDISEKTQATLEKSGVALPEKAAE